MTGGSRGRSEVWLAAPAALLAAGLAAYLVVSRAEPAATPVDPAGHASGGSGRAVHFRGAGSDTLGGEFVIPPEAAAARVPAVLIVPGHDSDRNGVTTGGGLPDPVYRDVAETLAASGIASLRYDRRGTGQSKLRRGQALTYDDVVADAHAGLGFLRQRREVDSQRTAIVGHLEGGLIAMRVAAEDPAVRGVVLLSTPGRPLVESTSDGLAAARGPDLATAFREAAASVVATGKVPDLFTLPPELQPRFTPEAGPYLQSLFSLDPAQSARSVGAPVLIVWGVRSPRVTGADADRLAAALGPRAERLAGERHSETLSLPALTPQPPPADGRYPDPGRMLTSMGPGGPATEPRDAEILGRIASWLGDRLGGA